MYCNLVIQIFRYLSETFDFKIIFIVKSENELIGYTDCDYTGLINGQKSIGDYIFILFDKLLSYLLKL